ncbi:putative quinol monooxygenase [Rugamonas sp.]|uniref:putative quinol monooxygenase n=1 Tax=Rugamonas sp. TaxID=1926287 RepID=UPI0025EC3B74|nr:putative quinol monooxygenase [Rugamonas sp.]
MSNLLVVVATLVAKPGHEATLKSALERVVPPSRAEAGCSRYELHSDNELPGRFIVLEEWRDAEALRQHEATPHFAALVQAIAGLADVQVSKLTKIA